MTDTDTSREAVERYDIEYPRLHATEREMCRDDEYGEWVRFDDYRALLARAEAAEAERDAAKAEAEGLRDAIKQYACEQNWTEDYEWDGPGAPTFVARAALQERANG